MKIRGETRLAHQRCSLTLRTMLGFSSKLLVCFMTLGVLFPQAGDFKPEIKRTPEGIAYLSTGVGYDSRINLPRFSLRLVFSAKTGKYLADIDVEIDAGQKKITQIHSWGPWLEVDLPPGHYIVRAHTAKGQEVSKSFTIKKDLACQIKLIWNISDEEI